MYVGFEGVIAKYGSIDYLCYYIVYIILNKSILTVDRPLHKYSECGVHNQGTDQRILGKNQSPFQQDRNKNSVTLKIKTKKNV